MGQVLLSQFNNDEIILTYLCKVSLTSKDINEDFHSNLPAFILLLKVIPKG